jgi:hypothetical protein
MEEGEAELDVGADAVQTVLRNVFDFADTVAAQVGKFRRFEVAPDLFPLCQHLVRPIET